MYQNISSLRKTLANTLIKNQQKIVTAESCTGGLLSAAFTQVAGASQWFERGFIVYSNTAKKTLLDVPEMILQRHGAVSHETAKAMAIGALKNSEATISIAITGIAGPTGGTPEKPVGLVYFGFSRKKHASTISITESQQFNGSRHQIRKNAVLYALQSLQIFMLKS